MTKNPDTQKKRWVLKIGNSLGESGDRIFDEVILARLVGEIVELQQFGLEIVLVSPGAITEGVKRLGWRQRPSDMPRLQAAAAVGQSVLMNAYEKTFRQNGLRGAQFLLTHEDFSDPQRHFNLQASLQKLITLKTVPVINENHVVSTPKTQLGGRDMLAALIAKAIDADRLVILTNKKFLCANNLYHHPRTEVFRHPSQEKNELKKIKRLGRGDLIGTMNKIKAVELFSASGGVATIATWQMDRVLREIWISEP